MAFMKKMEIWNVNNVKKNVNIVIIIKVVYLVKGGIGFYLYANVNRGMLKIK